MKWRWLVWLAWLAGPALGHEVRHEIVAGSAVVVTLRYADGTPFAFEKYELTPAGATVPLQVGNSDARGRITFLPDGGTNWRLKAYSADGHGVDLRFATPAPRETVAIPSTGPSRASLIFFGLGLILAAFGLLQLFITRKKP